MQIRDQAGPGRPQVDEITYARNSFHDRSILEISSGCQWACKEVLDIFSILGQSVDMKNRENMPRIDMAGVGRRLEALRQALNLSRKDFADSFGLDPSSYTKTVDGEKQLRSEAAYIIAERWGVSMDYIFRGRLTDLPEHLRESILKHLNAGA